MDVTQRRAHASDVTAKLQKTAAHTGGLAIYHRHTRFINFTEFALPQPTYINLVRNPVVRAVSEFYYKRWGQRDQGLKNAEIKARAAQQDWDINQCLALPRANRTCSFNRLDENEMTAIFCGQAPECACIGGMATRSCAAPTKQAALVLAKRNLQREYALVGVTERYANSLRLFERILPKFFNGATKVTIPHSNPTNHIAQHTSSRSIGESHFYREATPATVKRLAEELSLDLALYHFAVELFDQRYKACFGSEMQHTQERIHVRSEVPKSAATPRRSRREFGGVAPELAIDVVSMAATELDLSATLALLIDLNYNEDD